MLPIISKRRVAKLKASRIYASAGVPQSMVDVGEDELTIDRDVSDVVYRPMKVDLRLARAIIVASRGK